MGPETDVIGAVGYSNPAGAHRFNSRVRPTAFYRISCWTYGQHIRSCNERLSEAAYAPSAEPALLHAARLQHRGHAAPSRRNRNESHPRRTRRSHSRSSWMERRQRPQDSQKHLAPAAAAACAGARPQENIWQFMRANWLSNRIFKSFDGIVDHCCYAWNTLIHQPWKIMSIARRDWAAAGHSL